MDIIETQKEVSVKRKFFPLVVTLPVSLLLSDKPDG
jgi:hypothetical protein